MSDDWRDRLREVIKEDGRSLRAISAAAEGVGENYLQQMLKDEKDPTFPRLARVLSVLGPDATVYVTSGIRLGAPDQLRSILSAYGIGGNDLNVIMGVIGRFSGKTIAGIPEQTQSLDQLQPASLRHK